MWEGAKISSPAVQIWDPPHISETIRATKVKFYTHLDRSKYHFRARQFFRWGRAGGAKPPNVNLGPPHISETIRARKLKFYTHLDGSSTPFRHKNFPLGGS